MKTGKHRQDALAQVNFKVNQKMKQQKEQGISIQVENQFMRHYFITETIAEESGTPSNQHSSTRMFEKKERSEVIHKSMILLAEPLIEEEMAAKKKKKIQKGKGTKKAQNTTMGVKTKINREIVSSFGVLSKNHNSCRTPMKMSSVGSSKSFFQQQTAKSKKEATQTQQMPTKKLSPKSSQYLQSFSSNKKMFPNTSRAAIYEINLGDEPETVNVRHQAIKSGPTMTFKRGSPVQLMDKKGKNLQIPADLRASNMKMNPSQSMHSSKNFSEAFAAAKEELGEKRKQTHPLTQRNDNVSSNYKENNQMRQKPSIMATSKANVNSSQTASQMSYPAYLKNHLETNSRERQIKKNGSGNFMDQVVGGMQQREHRPVTAALMEENYQNLSSNGSDKRPPQNGQQQKKKQGSKNGNSKQQFLLASQAIQDSNSQYNSTQQNSAMKNPQVSDGLRQSKQQLHHPNISAFDYNQVNSANSNNRKASYHEIQSGVTRANGRNAILASQSSSALDPSKATVQLQQHTQTSLPHSIQDTGKALSKGQHAAITSQTANSGGMPGGMPGGMMPGQQVYQAPAKGFYQNQGSTTSFYQQNPYQEAANEDIRLKGKTKSQLPPSSNQSANSLKSKYLNQQRIGSAQEQDSQQQRSARGQYNNQSFGGTHAAQQQSNNMFDKPPTYQQSHRLEGSNNQPRMPFDLANTVLSSDSSQIMPSGVKVPKSSLAHKMQHIASSTAELQQKAQLKSSKRPSSSKNEDFQMLTERSKDDHNNPSSYGPYDDLNQQRGTRISAKIPAKVRASMMQQSANQTPQWQSMQTVQIQGDNNQVASGKNNSNSKFLNGQQSQAYDTTTKSIRQEGSPGLLKQNMQNHSLPKRGASDWQGRISSYGENAARVNPNVVQKKHQNAVTILDVNTVNIGVSMQEMQASKGKLKVKRQSQPSIGQYQNLKAHQPLSNQYSVSGAYGLHQKQPNKFPGSNQGDNQVHYRDQGFRQTHSDMNIVEKDIQVCHPLLSKSQSGVKKRPSMYQIPLPEDQLQFLAVSTDRDMETLEDSNFQMIRKPLIQSKHNHDHHSQMLFSADAANKGREQRSDSYIGRIRNFLGFTPAQGQEGGQQDEINEVRVTDVRKDFANHGRRSSIQGQATEVSNGSVPKLVLNLKELKSDEYQPVSSQKFESPISQKQLSSHRFKCSCEPSSEPYACSSAYRWLEMANHGRKFEIQKSRKSYLDLLGIKDFISLAEERQIECDITRTFPHQKIFQEPAGEGQQSLQRVLQAFSKYDQSIGYVQGMNFIVGALLLHCSEEVTFWLFVALIEDYEMRDIYMEGLPGHIKHSTLITQLMERHLGELYEHLQDIGMNVEIFATDWYFTLFAKVIPTYQMNAFFDSFFSLGWCFFHKFTLTLLRILAPQILQMDDMSEIKQLLLLPKHKQNFYGGAPVTGSSTTTTGFIVKSDQRSGEPFSQNSEEATDSTPGGPDYLEVQPQKRTFLSSIGSLFGLTRDGGSNASGTMDTQLQELMGKDTVEELLSKEDAWVRIIDITKNLWGKKLPDTAIKQYLNDYDELQEQNAKAQLNQDAKFNDSQGAFSDHNQSGDEVLISSPGKKMANGAQKKKVSDSPLPQGASFSSNELDDDNLEYPTNEVSPMKKVHDSAMRMPKQTKLMFKNMDNMRKASQMSPNPGDGLSRRTLTEQPFDVTDQKFVKSQKARNRDIQPYRREFPDEDCHIFEDDEDQELVDNSGRHIHEHSRATKDVVSGFLNQQNSQKAFAAASNMLDQVESVAPKQLYQGKRLTQEYMSSLPNQQQHRLNQLEHNHAKNQLKKFEEQRRQKQSNERYNQ